jgi:CubicO group peptidase (beta-lactamase class C family)
MTTLKPTIAAVLIAIGALTQLVAQPPPVWPGTKWAQASPESQGMSGAALAELDRQISEGAYGNVDRVLVIRRGHAVFDRRYSRDYREISRGKSGPLGCGEGCTDAAAMNEFNYYHPNWHPYYQGRDVHTLQSVTKSIAATVIGIAHARGAIASLDAPALSFFRDRDLSRVDKRLERATLKHVLTMQSGIEWHEGDRPLDATNTTYQLEKSADWIAFTLSQPMDAEPGTKWVYNSGGSQLLSGIIRKATGQHIDEYANATLFRPLGIRDFHWKKTPTGEPDTEGGLYLTADDLARIGYLYLRGGEWNGVRILPVDWVKAATARHVSGLPGGWGYGYQWWIASRDGVDVWAGRGFGGQFLFVIPARDIVAVVHSWNVFGKPAKPFLRSVRERADWLAGYLTSGPDPFGEEELADRTVGVEVDLPVRVVSTPRPNGEHGARRIEGQNLHEGCGIPEDMRHAADRFA